jgi:hypothetical protein
MEEDTKEYTRCEMYAGHEKRGVPFRKSVEQAKKIYRNTKVETTVKADSGCCCFVVICGELHILENMPSMCSFFNCFIYISDMPSTVFTVKSDINMKVRTFVPRAPS